MRIQNSCIPQKMAETSLNVFVGVLAVCLSPGKHWVRPLYSHRLIPIPDELARALAKLRGHKQRQTLPAARPKRTAAQAGLSAGPPVPEELLRKVVMGLRPERANSEPMWFSICTKIANIATANGYQDAGLRIFHDFSEQCRAKCDKTETDAKFARAVLNYNPQWGFFPLKTMLRKDNPKLSNQQRKEPALQRFFQEQDASEIVAKLKQFHLPDITSICKELDWELLTCHEPQLEDYSKETASGLVIWSKPGTGKFLLQLCLHVTLKL